MAPRKALDAKASVLMIALCAIWGMQQVAMKAAAAAMAPTLQVSVRSIIAILVVGVLAHARGETAAFRGGTWRAGVVVGVLFGLEFLLVAESLRFTTASHVTIFLYTGPIFAALGLHWTLPEERLAPLQWIGIAFAFLGVAISFAARGTAGDTGLIGDSLALAAGASWGATTVALRGSKLGDTPSNIQVLYQLAGAFVILTAACAITGSMKVTFTPVLLVSMAFQIVFVAIVSLLVWFALLRTYLASRLGVLSFMTPLFAVIFGKLILGDELDISFITGAFFVLIGILLVGGRQMFKLRFQRTAV